MDDVEKVARAMWMASRPINPAGILNWDAMLDEYKEQWRVYARAALSALGGRDEAPTEEMKLAGARALRQSFGWPNQVERAAHCYEAMLALRRQATGEGDQPRKAGE